MHPTLKNTSFIPMSTARLFTVLLLAVLAIQPQAFSQVPDIQQTVDSLYGLNDLLVNGRVFANPHPRANGHPFFNGLAKLQRA